ncbi:MAG: hypothetical protein P9L91_01640 [Candidatus Zophobacter franzmannii]|nr:hypothetical protein [Candidatus Zophobacter franzmannii]
MNYRKYDHEKDKDSLFRICNEIGWAKKPETFWLTEYIPKTRTLVSDLNGQAECFANSVLGNYYYLGQKLTLSAINGIGTSLVARKQRLASKLTVAKIVEDVMDGADIAGLGFFEQGYYDQFGFGNNGYEHIVRFTPSSLKLKRDIPVPVRIGIEHASEIYEVRANRHRVHGNVVLPEICNTGDLQDGDNYQGYGFRDEDGTLTHLIWVYGRGSEHGMFRIYLLYQNYEQFLDLLALIKSFGDQITIARISEPPGIQIQDFLNQPFTYRRLTTKSPYENSIKATSWSQVRILNLENCISKLKTIKPVSFNLKLSDPIVKYLPENSPWAGIGGEYIVRLGSESMVEKGVDNSLLTLEASVGAFTRLWAGVLKATQLRYSDELFAHQELLTELDEAINLPIPRFDWDF